MSSSTARRTSKTGTKVSDNDRLLRTVAGRSVFKSLTRAIASRTGASPAVFNHVARAAQGFMTGLAVDTFSRKNTQTPIWVVCSDTRSQEELFNALRTWHGEAFFFPELEIATFEDALPDPENAAERLTVLHQIADLRQEVKMTAKKTVRKPPAAKKKTTRKKPKGSTSASAPLVVLTLPTLEELVPRAESFLSRELRLSVGEEYRRADILEKLTEAGYEQVPQVFVRGQFAIRGGILDVFSWQAQDPVRIEFFDEDIESIREFDVDSQTTVNRIPDCAIMLGDLENTGCAVRDYIAKDDLVITVECELEDAGIVITSGANPQTPDATEEDFSTACYDNPVGMFDAGDFVLQEAKRNQFRNQLMEWRSLKWQVHMFFNNEGERERFDELLAVEPIEEGTIQEHIAPLPHGFTIPSAKIAVLSGPEIFGRYQNNRAQRMFNRDRKRVQGRAVADFKELSHGDRVIHSEYGLGIYRGLSEIELEKRDTDDSSSEKLEEVLILEYADTMRLYVPLDQAHLVSRYVGAGKTAPPLSRLGDGKWGRTRKAAEKSIMDYAAQLLSLQARRDTAVGFAHEPDGKWQSEFEHSFVFKETRDQIHAIQEAKLDMESAKPMDRLICGDVGFGKTEVAIRAAFKSVMNGKQVAILAPTTVLAQQHWKTFRERMSDYPVKVELLNRFRTAREQREVLKGMASGTVDIVIGTHRLISKDIRFKNLGLVVVDEEQRFGVRHKERFKEMFHLVDVLTLSATPIPRTLYLSLMGVRDMSTIDTPPANRYPVTTTICPYDERTIRSAMKRELKRGGQIYFLHNRVASIEKTKQRLEELCPGARVETGHGQMEEGALQPIMQRFIDGETDILVCTTIIESGIDIPNANTIIIDRADRFGLADLYQLRGRVGRAQHKAYALLMLPPDMLTAGDARKRVNAIKQYSSLGAGFKIAMRDLEIRGAGNLLGTQQSGHITAVGFDLYCKLLKQSIGRLKGETVTARADVAMRIDFLVTREVEYAEDTGSGDTRLPAFIPRHYISDPRMRISAYKSLAELSSKKELNSLIKNWRDRFGRFPDSVDNLLLCNELRLQAAMTGISAVEIQSGKLMLTRNGDYVLIHGKFPRITADSDKIRLREALNMVKKF